MLLSSLLAGDKADLSQSCPRGSVLLSGRAPRGLEEI